MGKHLWRRDDITACGEMATSHRRIGEPEGGGFCSSLVLDLPTDILDKAVGFLEMGESYFSNSRCACRRLQQACSRVTDGREEASSRDFFTEETLTRLSTNRTASFSLMATMETQLLSELRKMQSLTRLSLQGLNLTTPRNLLSVIRHNCPLLQALNLAGNERVDDLCLEEIALACPRLRVLNITFCNQTTYQGVVHLREELGHEIFVRRQPEWLDGRFVCPWGEVHTYYADGTFTFTRDSQSVGWVCWLQDRGSFLEDRLQYVDFPFMSKGPGVLLRRVVGHDDQVLVAQQEDSLDPPVMFPPDHQVSSLPVGESATFEVEYAPGETAAVMVSRMEVRRFGEGEKRMPPADLLRRIDDFLEDWNSARAIEVFI